MAVLVRVTTLVLVVVLLLVTGATSGTTTDEDASMNQSGTSWHTHPYQGPTPVQIPAGHIEPAGGLVVLGARDDLWWHTMNQLPFDPQVIGGLICQVPPGSDPCPPIPPESAPGNLVFCHGISLWEGENWHKDLDTYVWVGVFDQLGQSPGQVWCENARPATTGVVTHWPGH